MPRKGKKNKESQLSQQPQEIVLLGDSTLDNIYWVDDGDEVTALLSKRLPEMHVVNLAVDGFTTDSVLRGEYKDAAVSSVYHPHEMFKPLVALNKLNKVEYVVLSVLGNDCRAQLQELVFSPADNRAKLVEQTIDSIVTNYAEIVQKIRQTQPLAKLIIMTQYTPDLTNDLYKIYFLMYLLNTKKTISDTLSAIFTFTCYKIFASTEEKNRAAVQTFHGLMARVYQAIFNTLDKESVAVIDLSSSFDYRDTTLFHSQIEPSKKGGGLISDMIEHVVNHHDFSKPAQLYAKPPGQITPEMVCTPLATIKDSWSPGHFYSNQEHALKIFRESYKKHLAGSASSSNASGKFFGKTPKLFDVDKASVKELVQYAQSKKDHHVLAVMKEIGWLDEKNQPREVSGIVQFIK